MAIRCQRHRRRPANGCAWSRSHQNNVRNQTGACPIHQRVGYEDGCIERAQAPVKVALDGMFCVWLRYP